MRIEKTALRRSYTFIALGGGWHDAHDESPSSAGSTAALGIDAVRRFPRTGTTN
jgi:hypothetical protein